MSWPIPMLCCTVARPRVRSDKGLPKLFVPIWILVAIAGVCAHAQCKAGDVLIGEDSDNYYCMAEGKFQGTQTQKLGLQFCQAKQIVAADEKAIANLGFALDSERIGLYESIAREQKAEFQNKILDEMLNQAMAATLLLARSAKSLNPWDVNQAVAILRDKGFDNEVVVSALRRVAAQKRKPQLAAAYNDFVDVAKGAQEGWRASQGVATDPANAHLRLLLGAFKAVQGNYELGLVVTALEFGESIAYLGYLSGKSNAIEQLTDDQLPRLPRLTERLKANVAEMLQAKSAWQQSSGHPGAVPECGL